MIEGDSLEEILAQRGDSLAGARSSWARELLVVPADAAAPLAMSGPHPRAVGSYGPQCLAWAKREMKFSPRWWQALAITRQLEHDADGALVYREVVESGPRRIGKSVRLRVTALWRIANAELFRETQLAMLVSKDLAVGKEIHRPAWAWAEKRSPKWNVLRLGGAQEIETPAGDRWLLRAPNAAYGYDVGYGQVDESWDVDPQAITDGIEPALLERESPQLHMTSTAHVRASSLMRRRLTAALRDADPDVLLLMWGAAPGADFADEATWRSAAAHWSMARRDLMARKYAAAVAGEADPEIDDPDPVRGWAAQYLNVWPLLIGGEGAGIFPRWSDLATDAEPPAPAALGIAADVEQQWLSLGASSGGEKPHLGSVFRSRGIDAAVFVAEVARIQSEQGCPVAIDERGPASFLIPDLRDAGVRLSLYGTEEFMQASSDLADAVENQRVVHGDYPELNAAVAAAGWRYVNDRRLFARKLGDISALEAVAWAMYAARRAPSREFWGAFA